MGHKVRIYSTQAEHTVYNNRANIYIKVCEIPATKVKLQ